MNRRNFLTNVSAMSVAGLMLSRKLCAEEAVPTSYAGAGKTLPPVTQLTHGPKYHWGAYYDQMHFDPTDRFVTGNEVDFHGRSPRPEDQIHVGLIDTGDNNRWTQIGTSRAWNWQQGPMLQWIPGRTSFESAEVIWNDRAKDHFFSHIYCPATGKYREMPGPAYVVSPDGTYALHPDFARLNDTRPGYGYCGLPDPNFDVLAPTNAGIWRMDLATGEEKLLFSFKDVVDIVPEGGYSTNAKHWFNHLLISPDSKRFLFLHRWRGVEEKSYWKTRLLTVNADGSDLFVLNPYNMTSHLVWRDPTHIIAYCRQPSHGNRFYELEDRTGKSTVIGCDMMKVDGHVSYIPHANQEWILNDTYPNRDRMQELFMFHIGTETKISLGFYRLGPEFQGEWRCDLHPRCNHAGTKVLFDSCHLDGGRQIYLADISEYREWM